MRKENEESIEENKLEIITQFMLGILLFVGIFCFINYLPITLTNPKDFFFNQCCSTTKCNITQYCKKYLEIWFQNSNISKNILNECCYWFAPFLTPKNLIKSYCNSSCLKIY